MRRKVRLKITNTSERTILLPTSTFRALCPLCEREVEVLTIEQATSVTRQSTLSELIADRRVHLIQTDINTKLVCKDSLFSN